MRIAGGCSSVSSLLLAFSTAFAQSPTSPAFEVASIKPATFPSDAFFQGFSDSGTCNKPQIAISGNRVTFQFVSVCGLIRMAYDVPDYRITGLPESLTKRDKSTFYEIQALSGSDGTLTETQIRPMLQTLLADRFQLKLHRETKDLPVYALVVGKNGSKLSTEPLPCAADRKLIPFAGLRGTGFAVCKPTMSMAKFAEQLGQPAGRPVIDETGLAGEYAFSLIYSAEGATIEANSAPSISTAIQEQLGLKLEPEKAPVEMLVIARAQPPSMN
jgi:uncharacterized protein (TIGR03435 family)